MVATYALHQIPDADWIAVYDGSDQEYGNALNCTVDGHITGIRFYRIDTSASARPNNLVIREYGGSTPLLYTNVFPDDYEVGWQEYELPSPIVAPAGVRFIASAEIVGRENFSTVLLGTQYPSPLYPAGLAVAPSRLNSPPEWGATNTIDLTQIFGIDLRFEANRPTATWVSLGTQEYEETLLWEQPADRYRLTMSSYPEWRYAVVVEGVDVRRIKGFWSPYDGGYVQGHHTIDGPNADLLLPGPTRMAGLLLDTGSGSAGTVEAFELFT